MHTFQGSAYGILRVPDFPVFMRPDWIRNKIDGVKDVQYYQSSLFVDVLAGATVGLSQIPQALAFAILARLPATSGLYALILPCLVYGLLGSGKQLAVGPSLLASLVMGQLVNKYHIDDEQEAFHFAISVSVCVGVWLLFGGLFNMGGLIRMVSYPVLVGFSTASAWVICLNQVKDAFGFSFMWRNVPEVGGRRKYYYKLLTWYLQNWNKEGDGAWNGHGIDSHLHINKLAVGFFGCMMAGLIFYAVVKKFLMVDSTQNKKKTLAQHLFAFIGSLFVLVCLLACAREAYLIRKSSDTHHARELRVVGKALSMYQFLHTPELKFFNLGMLKLFKEVFPLATVIYMEGYAVAKKSAASRGRLPAFSGSQEMIALGLGNLANYFSPGHPVSGSFDMSALYRENGAVSTIARTMPLVVMLFAVGFLGPAFEFVPRAALSAVVVLAALRSLDLRQFWLAWRFSLEDFFVMVVTFTVTLLFHTDYGLCAGAAASALTLLIDLTFSLKTAHPVRDSDQFEGLTVIRLNKNLIYAYPATVKYALMDEVKFFC